MEQRMTQADDFPPARVGEFEKFLTEVESPAGQEEQEVGCSCEEFPPESLFRQEWVSFSVTVRA